MPRDNMDDEIDKFEAEQFGNMKMSPDRKDKKIYQPKNYLVYHNNHNNHHYLQLQSAQGPIESAAGNAAVDESYASGADILIPDCVKSRNIDGTLQDYIKGCPRDDIIRAKITWVKHRHNKLIGTLSKNLTPLKKIL